MCHMIKHDKSDKTIDQYFSVPHQFRSELLKNCFFWFKNIIYFESKYLQTCNCRVTKIGSRRINVIYHFFIKFFLPIILTSWFWSQLLTSPSSSLFSINLYTCYPFCIYTYSWFQVPFSIVSDSFMCSHFLSICLTFFPCALTLFITPSKLLYFYDITLIMFPICPNAVYKLMYILSKFVNWCWFPSSSCKGDCRLNLINCSRRS